MIAVQALFIKNIEMHLILHPPESTTSTCTRATNTEYLQGLDGGIEVEVSPPYKCTYSHP